MVDIEPSQLSLIPSKLRYDVGGLTGRLMKLLRRDRRVGIESTTFMLV